MLLGKGLMQKTIYRFFKGKLYRFGSDLDSIDPMLLNNSLFNLQGLALPLELGYKELAPGKTEV